jgi:hypothetical protein
VLAQRVLLHGAGQTPKFARFKFEPIRVSGCLNFEVFHHEGHAASRIRQGKSLREDKPAAGYILEPRPTKAVEDEYENEKGDHESEKLQCVPLDTSAVWPMYEY